MSAQVNTHETLFSFEVLVDSIRIESGQYGDLALALRLLDFPTLIVYQKNQRRPPDELHDGDEDDDDDGGEPGDHVFRKGKSCLFKISIEALIGQLADTPLYAMVLDVTGEVPTLVGTSLIPLGPLVRKISVDVDTHGVSTPSSHGEKGHFGVLNLMGNRIGWMSLRYKLLSLGTSLLPHILEKRTHVISGVHEREHVQIRAEQDTCFKQSFQTVDLPPCGREITSSDLRGETLLQSNRKCDAMSACVATQTEPAPRLRANPTPWVESWRFEENPNVFCPPNLFYSSSGEETAASPGVDEVEEGVFEVEGVEAFAPDATERRTPQTAPAMKRNTNGHTQVGPDPSGLMQDVPLEMLRQLPLLNALLVELSQLTRQGVHQQPLSIHPHLAWIYSPTLAQPPPVVDGTTPTAPTQWPNTPRQKADPRLRDGSKPQTVSKKRNNTKTSNTSSGRTLKYGTTRTFQLRLNCIPAGQTKHRECLGIQSLSQTQTPTKSPSDGKKHSGLIKHDRGAKAVNQTTSVAVIHSSADDSAARETGRLHTSEHQSKHAGETFKVDVAGEEPLKVSLHAKSNTKRIPAAALRRGDGGGGSTQARPLPDRTTDEETDHDERSRSSNRSSSRLWSPRSTHRSASSRSRRGGGGGHDEEQYMDDFNSLDPSEGRSPEPLSSPESGLAPLSRSTRLSHSPGSSAGSNGPLRRGPPLPVPTGARGSPQRSLTHTHIIRSRTQVSALSVSSDDDGDDGGRSVGSSRAAVRSRAQARGPGGVHDGGAPRSSVTESLRSSRGRLSDLAQNRGSAGGLSADSDASRDSCEVEELRDGLGSLDLKINYQHISELVANKLPGYTL